MHAEPKAGSLWSEFTKHPLLSGGMLVCFIGAIGSFFGPRVVGLVLLFLALVLCFLILVSAESLRGRSNRWRIIGRACLICTCVFVPIGYVGVKWGPGGQTEATRPQRTNVTQPEQQASSPAPPLHSAPPVEHNDKPDEGGNVLQQPIEGATPAPRPQQEQASPAEPLLALPLPMKRITIATQEQVNPTKEDAPFAAKVVVTTTAEIQPTWLVLMCNAQVMYAEVYMNQGGFSCSLTSLEVWRSQDGNTVWVGFTEPAFLPETPLVFTLSGSERIVAQSVEEERPPADAQRLRSTGLQITM